MLHVLVILHNKGFDWTGIGRCVKQVKKEMVLPMDPCSRLLGWSGSFCSNCQLRKHSSFDTVKQKMPGWKSWSVIRQAPNMPVEY
jgi:hypothetical protein